MGKNDVEVHLQEDRNNSSGIVPIDKDVVHKICSGQVVLSLAVAVKELLENSLDAGATSIDIRLVDHGSTLVEVSDNGCGIKEDDFEGIALKHHTSKLSSFSDLDSVETFGFRGEALSSLCSLCGGISVVTCHSSATCATMLQFDSKGIITRRTPCARQVGTTISLESLFSGLPVRRKEFLRNLQREFAKMTHLLYAYCLVSTGVRITCTNRNQKKGGHSSVVVATQGGLTVRDNIACVFGHKQLMTIVDFKQKEASNEILEEFGLKKRNSECLPKQEQCEGELEGVEEMSSAAFTMNGYLSSCEHGKGRGAPDRQFFFINSRPCEPIKVMKLVNEVYHQYNSHQNPFVFLNIKTYGSGVDVNVTPDKRKIFLEDEKLLLATVKASLLEMYASTPTTFQLQNLAFKERRIEAQTISTEEEAVSTHSNSLKNQNSPTAALTISQVLSKFSQSSSIVSAKERQLPKRKCSSETGTRNKQPKMDKFCMLDQSNPCGNAQTIETLDSQESAMVIEMAANCSSLKNDEKPSFVECPNEQSEEEKSLNFVEETVKISEMENDICALSEHDSNDVVNVNNVHACEEAIECDISSRNVSLGNVAENSSFKTEVSLKSHSLELEVDIKETLYKISEQTVGEKLEIVVLDDAPAIKDCDVHVIMMDLSIADVANKCHEYEVKRKRKKIISRRKAKFMADITPKENDTAEKELQREITKEMFSKMRIIGQFNLGFIVTQLDSDLFIIDQHASDEKYNFETLQLTTTLQQQPLVVPQPLDLTAASKAILMENLEVFEKNGFKFLFPHEDDNCRTCLTSIPFCKNWTFGKEDVDELIFMLQDSPHTNCRPSRVRDMFASRACRKSVMIGTALSTAEMHQIVKNMGLIEQPWNCPHGRPTMRHLINLDLVI